MDFRIADTFTDSLARLTGDEQKAVKTTAFDLQLNPAHPGMSLHLHRLSPCKVGLRRSVTMLICRRFMTPSGICCTWPVRGREIICW